MTHAPSVDEQVSILADLYSKRAPAYDTLWSPVIRPSGERLLDRLPLAEARDVIDIGCGSGALLPLIQSRAPLATVMGVDRSPGMLEFARQKHAGPLAVMDAEQLELPDGSFDVAVMAFVLFHLPHPDRALHEVSRVLRVGGTAGLATWTDEEPPAANAIWNEELTAAGAAPIELPAVDTFEATDSAAKVGALLTDAGMTVLQVTPERIEYRWAPADHRDLHVRSTSRARLALLNEADRRDCLGRVDERLATLEGSEYTFRGGVLLTTATKGFS